MGDPRRVSPLKRIIRLSPAFLEVIAAPSAMQEAFKHCKDRKIIFKIKKSRYLCNVKTINLAAMSKYLNPKADLTFKKVFGEHKNLVIAPELLANSEIAEALEIVERED